MHDAFPPAAPWRPLSAPGGWVCAGALALALGGAAAADVVLHDHGPLVNLPFGGAAGAHASRVQGELGFSQLGFGGAESTVSSEVYVELCDDFTVDTPGGWQVSRVRVYSIPYGTGVGSEWIRLGIWDGPPWAGGTELVGSFSQAAFISTGIYRVPSGNSQVTNYPVTARDFPVSVTLQPGHYYVVWQPDAASGLPVFRPQVPPVTIAGQGTTGQARMRTTGCDIFGCSSSAWLPLFDGPGPQGLPFQVLGSPETRVKGNLDGVQGPDLLFRNVDAASPNFNRNKVWFMDGARRSTEAFITPDSSGPEWRVVGSDDFDSASAPGTAPDGHTDLVLQDPTTGQLEFWLMNGASRTGPARPLQGASTPPLNWKPAATGDFNHDGRPDLVWRNATSQKIVIWVMNGTRKLGAIIPSPDQAVHANWEIVSALDYNQDGQRDFLWYNLTSGKLVTWYMDAGVQRLSGQYVEPPSAGNSNWKVVAGGDYSWSYVAGAPLNAPDIVWRNETSGSQVIWHLDFASTRVWSEFTIPPSNDLPVGQLGKPMAPLDWVIVGPR